MAIIWLDIWDVQSRSKARGLINKCFNVRRHIVTIRGTNMNPEVLQYKNCWKWNHTIFSYRIQESKYIKCNGLHKSKHHCHFACCCKANLKLTLLGSKLSRKNYVPTPSSVQIAKVIIRQTITSVSSEDIGLTRNSTQRNTKSFVKIEDSQFIHL